jgi:hypothetical protein
MKTIADRAALESLLARMAALAPDSQRRWGTFTAHEMLCHLGDAMEMVLRTRPRATPIAVRHRPFVKLFGLWAPFPWPHGWPTNPQHNPRVDGTRPSEFATDLNRVICSLRALGAPDHDSLEPAHGFFGQMSTADWQRWAYRHADHHLRQFGV